jgi:hypothetical protein
VKELYVDIDKIKMAYFYGKQERLPTVILMLSVSGILYGLCKIQGTSRDQSVKVLLTNSQTGNISNSYDIFPRMVLQGRPCKAGKTQMA